MLKQGIYEHIINQEIDRKMQEAEQSGLVCVQQPIDGTESPQMLANYLANAISQKLEDTEEQQDIVNHIADIRTKAKALQAEGTAILEDAKRKVEQMIIGE